MELLISIAYFSLVWLIFINYKLLRFSLFWKFVVFGIWIGALLTEVLALGQFAPYSKSAFVQTYVVQMAPEWGGLVKEVYIKPNVPIKKGDPLFQMDPDEKQYKVDLYTAQLAAEARSEEQLMLGKDAAERALEAGAVQAVAAAAEVEAGAAMVQFEAQYGANFAIELPTFLTMVARKLGSDSMFVLAYSVSGILDCDSTYSLISAQLHGLGDPAQHRRAQSAAQGRAHVQVGVCAE